MECLLKLKTLMLGQQKGMFLAFEVEVYFKTLTQMECSWGRGVQISIFLITLTATANNSFFSKLF